MQAIVFGAGAVGGYIGAKLIASGADVSFIARGTRLKQLSERGLVVQSPLGDSETPVRASELPPPYLKPQVIVLACKAPALAGAIATIAPCVGQDTRILPVLNGVRHLTILQQAFPHNPILGGIAHGAVTLAPDGTTAHLSAFFSLIVGSLSGERDAVAQNLVERLATASLDARLSADIHQDLWSKFVFLTTLAGMTCLMRANVGTIMATKEGPRLARQLFNECLAVAKKEDRAIEPRGKAAYLDVLTKSGSSLTSSMLRDVERGRRTECDHILGDMLCRAKSHGLDTPVLKICLAHLACYEAGLVSQNETHRHHAAD